MTECSLPVSSTDDSLHWRRIADWTIEHFLILLCHKNIRRHQTYELNEVVAQP